MGDMYVVHQGEVPGTTRTCLYYLHQETYPLGTMYGYEQGCPSQYDASAYCTATAYDGNPAPSYPSLYAAPAAYTAHFGTSTDPATYAAPFETPADPALYAASFGTPADPALYAASFGTPADPATYAAHFSVPADSDRHALAYKPVFPAAHAYTHTHIQGEPQPDNQ
jgi:hypothetical protein